MNWVISNNYAKAALTNQDMFGQIRRDVTARQAQIQVFQNRDKYDPPMQWIALVDYRYGMNQAEIAEDVKVSGITHEEWRKIIKEFLRIPYVKPAHYNGRKIDQAMSSPTLMTVYEQEETKT
jgi:hypothetical protein